jgi:RNA polymerase sigma factor
MGGVVQKIFLIPSENQRPLPYIYYVGVPPHPTHRLTTMKEEIRMEDIAALVLASQDDPQKLNDLIEKFLPFIKNCVARERATRQSRDDALTLAMLAFADGAKTYRSEKGPFLPYAQTAIRNRLIDDYRSERKHVSRSVPMRADENEAGLVPDARLSLETYQIQREQASLRFEIEEAGQILAAWGITFASLTKVCPKQKRTRSQCEYIAALILKNEEWRAGLMQKYRMPKKDICRFFGISEKILEKYKKYIAALCLIQSGDFPMLRAFLPMNRRGGMEYE